MSPERTHEGKWVLYSVTTGRRFERWSVDATGMIASGDYTADPTECQLAAATVAAAPIIPAAPLPTEHVLGVPLVVTQSGDTAPAQLSPIPTGQTSKGRRAK